MRQVAWLVSLGLALVACTRNNPGSGSADLAASGGGGGSGGSGGGGGGGAHDLAMSSGDLAAGDMLSSTYDGVVCGSAGATNVCRPPMPLCCWESGNSGLCVSTPPPSPCLFLLACDGHEDCSGSDVCCLQMAGGKGSSTCTPADQCKSSGQTPLCHPGRPVATECGAAFAACCPLLTIPGYGYCGQLPCS